MSDGAPLDFFLDFQTPKKQVFLIIDRIHGIEPSSRLDSTLFTLVLVPNLGKPLKPGKTIEND